MMQEIKEPIKEYILKEFLPGEDPAALTDSTPLITGGILDSLATIKLVLFLEERFQIKIQAHETMVDYLNTISDIAQLVHPSGVPLPPQAAALLHQAMADSLRLAFSFLLVAALAAAMLTYFAPSGKTTAHQ